MDINKFQELINKKLRKQDYSYYTQSLKIRDNEELSSLPDNLVVSYLELQNIGLKYIPESLIVKELMILNCADLKIIPELRLESLHISCCPHLEEIHALVSESFSVTSCPNVKKLPIKLALRNHLDMEACLLDPLDEKIKRVLKGNFSIKEINNLQDL